MMGWTWRQQLWLLLQCMGLGVSLGVLYDLFGVVRLWRSRRRRSLFLTDALFGVLAALVTFFTALAIMDGRMHPLLFFGSAFGFTVQHLTLGRVASRALYRAGAALFRAGRSAAAVLMRPLRAVRIRWSGRKKREKKPTKGKKDALIEAIPPPDAKKSQKIKKIS